MILEGLTDWGLIGGRRGIGKTSLALQLAAQVAGGHPILGCSSQTGPVCFINVGDPEDFVKERLDSIVKLAHPQHPIILRSVPRNFRRTHPRELLKLVPEGCVAVFLDGLRAFDPYDPSSYEDILDVAEKIEEMRQLLHNTILIVVDTLPPAFLQECAPWQGHILRDRKSTNGYSQYIFAIHCKYRLSTSTPVVLKRNATGFFEPVQIKGARAAPVSTTDKKG